MNGSKSNYLAKYMLDNVLGNSTFATGLFLAVFTTLPDDLDAGGVEVSGGGYSRYVIPNDDTYWPDATGSSFAQKSNGQVFTFPAATTAWGDTKGWGLYDNISSGNLLFFGEALGAGQSFFVDTGTNIITASGHGFIDNNSIRIRNADGILPEGLLDATKYYVISATTNTFQVSASLGGSEVDITSNGYGTNTAHLEYFKTIDQSDVLSYPSGGINIIEN